MLYPTPLNFALKLLMYNLTSQPNIDLFIRLIHSLMDISLNNSTKHLKTFGNLLGYFKSTLNKEKEFEKWEEEKRNLSYCMKLK